jgi:hypothetical protein
MNNRYRKINTVSELLNLSNSEFISESYELFLKRKADADGFLNHLTLIENGLNKIDLLISLIESNEGTKIKDNERAIRILKNSNNGLFKIYYRNIKIQKPFQYKIFNKLNGTNLITFVYKSLLNRQPTNDEISSHLIAAENGAEKYEIIETILNKHPDTNHKPAVSGLWYQKIISKIYKLPIIGNVIAIVYLILNAKLLIKQHYMLILKIERLNLNSLVPSTRSVEIIRYEDKDEINNLLGSYPYIARKYMRDLQELKKIVNMINNPTVFKD